MARPLGPVPEHGTRQRYQLRQAPCRCLPCRAANRRYVKARRTRVAWTQPPLPPEYMFKCGHSGQDHNQVCAWCGTPLRQAG
jgi:hypothetical protein